MLSYKVGENNGKENKELGIDALLCKPLLILHPENIRYANLSPWELGKVMMDSAALLNVVAFEKHDVCSSSSSTLGTFFKYKHFNQNDFEKPRLVDCK